MPYRYGKARWKRWVVWGWPQSIRWLVHLNGFCDILRPLLLGSTFKFGYVRIPFRLQGRPELVHVVRVDVPIRGVKERHCLGNDGGVWWCGSGMELRQEVGREPGWVERRRGALIAQMVGERGAYVSINRCTHTCKSTVGPCSLSFSARCTAIASP